MKKPITTTKLFTIICKILKNKGKMPDILDYSLATNDPLPIKTYEFNPTHNLDYGCNEGIYLTVSINVYENEKNSEYKLGTFKTLSTDDKSMHIMADLLADFVIECRNYVNSNLDDFTWFGADVHPFGKDGKKCRWGYSCRTMEYALKRKDELLKRYTKVWVRDNVTRKETIYTS